MGLLLGNSSEPVVAAHRGASRRAPENTLASFEAAMSLGATALELDVHLTSDFDLAVIHDPLVDRTTDGDGPVASFSTHQLSKLDAGSWFSPTFARERVPLLADVLPLTAGRARLNIELKSAAHDTLAEKVVETVLAHGAADRVVIMSFDLGSVLAAKRHALARGLGPGPTGLPVMSIIAERLADPFGFVTATGLDGLNYPPPLWDGPTVARFRESHLLVHGGLINDRTVLEGFFRIGGQMADTDEPDCYQASAAAV